MNGQMAALVERQVANQEQIIALTYRQGLQLATFAVALKRDRLRERAKTVPAELARSIEESVQRRVKRMQ